MNLVLSAVVYLGMAAFLAGCIVRAVRYAKAPVHLRWELYPVPHEPPERAAHGGSRYEETDWWTKPSRRNLWGEWKFMVPEMVFLKGLWEFNRPLWFRSFPFHFGLYLLMATAGLVALTAAFPALAPYTRRGYAITGAGGACLALAGAAGLLLRRLRDPALRIYTTAGDVFNLLFFIATLGSLAAGYLIATPSVSATARALLGFEASPAVPAAVVPGVALAALLIAYIPLTHMSHFIAKYFTYHSIRWDDAAGATIERKIAEYLTYRPAWSAAHIGADGKKSWADVATANPTRGSAK